MSKSNVVKLNKSTSKKSEKSVEPAPITYGTPCAMVPDRSPVAGVLVGLCKLDERISQANSALCRIVAKYGIDAKRERDVQELSNRLDMMRDEKRCIYDNFVATTMKSPEEYVLRQIARASYIIKEALFSGKSRKVTAAAEKVDHILHCLADEAEETTPGRSAEVERSKKLRKVISDVTVRLANAAHSAQSTGIELEQIDNACTEIVTAIEELQAAENELSETIDALN